MTNTTEAVLAQLAKARAERKDELDLPRTLTQRQVNDYFAHTAALDNHIRGIRLTQDLLTKPCARRDALVPARDRLRAAQAAIEKQIADAPDWRTIGNSRER